MLDEKMLKIYGSVDVKGAGACPTVKILNPAAPGEFVIINESDFDPEAMTLYVEAEPKGHSRR